MKLCEDPFRAEMDVLLSLSNHCEFFEDASQPSESDHKERAAMYRQQLFVVMIEQGRDVSRKCGMCRKRIDAHLPSKGTSPNWILMANCCHSFHAGCIRICPSGNKCKLCPVCHEPLSVHTAYV